MNNQIGSFEVIVVDDASTDNTKNLIKNNINNLKYDLSYIKLKKKVGLPQARNIGILHSNYNIIGYLDDDCLPLRNDLLNRAFRWLNLKEGEIVGVGGPIYSNLEITKRSKKNSFLGKEKKTIKIFSKIPEYLEKFYYRRLNLTLVNSLPGGNCFFKKEVVNNCGGFNPIFDGNYYREETDLCFKVKKYGKLISDPKMPVCHLQISSGGCRREIDLFFSNVLSNTILLILIHKTLTIEVLFDTLKHLLVIFSIIITGKERYGSNIIRTKVLLSFFNGVLYGLKKFYSHDKKFNQPVIEEAIKF